MNALFGVASLQYQDAGLLCVVQIAENLGQRVGPELGVHGSNQPLARNRRASNPP
jgi:hypothetical protein